MTGTDDTSARGGAGQSSSDEPHAAERRDPLTVVAEVCPFLTASGGGWRHSDPSREHRCDALRPPAPLSSEKQRRLCLTAQHVDCATFVAAVGGSRGPGVVLGGGGVVEAAASRWAFARTAPVVFDSTGIPTSVGALTRGHGGQLVLAGLLVVALVAVGASRFATPRSAAIVTAPSPSPAALLGVPSPSPLPTNGPTAALSPPASPAGGPPKATPSPLPTARPTAGPTIAPTRVYTVRQGDTLGSIAARFGTTVGVLEQLNGISNPRSLRVGQVLRIP